RWQTACVIVATPSPFCSSTTPAAWRRSSPLTPCRPSTPVRSRGSPPHGTWIYDFHPVVDRWLVSTPMVYLQSLGAGGGSIARYDRLWRTVEVGPDSAGRGPRPRCFRAGRRQSAGCRRDVS